MRVATPRPPAVIGRIPLTGAMSSTMRIPLITVFRVAVGMAERCIAEDGRLMRALADLPVTDCALHYGVLFLRGLLAQCVATQFQAQWRAARHCWQHVSQDSLLPACACNAAFVDTIVCDHRARQPGECGGARPQRCAAFYGRSARRWAIHRYGLRHSERSRYRTKSYCEFDQGLSAAPQHVDTNGLVDSDALQVD